jgi:hypothetical protein
MKLNTIIPLLETALAGAVALNLSDDETRSQILAICDDDRRELTTPEAADYLSKSEITLKQWRMKKIGPKYRKDIGGYVRYELRWLREFQDAAVVRTGTKQDDR